MKLLSVLLLSALVLLGVGCTEDVNQSASLQYELAVMDRFEQPVSQFLPGEEIRLQLTATNEGSTPQTLYFTSGQEADFELLAADGARVWLWSDAMVFTEALHQREVAPGSQVTKLAFICGPETVPEVDPECPLLRSGTYTLRAWFLGSGAELETELHIL